MANKQKNMNKKGMGLRPFLLSLITVMLFSFFLFQFAYGFIIETNPSSDILSSNYSLNSSITRMNNSLASVENLAVNIKNQTLNSKAESTNYLFLIFQGAFEIPKTIFVFAINSVVTLFDIIFNIAGNSKAITISLTIIIAGIIITLVALIVSFIRTGQSER